MTASSVMTYGRRRLPLSARNIAIAAARTAPPPLLPSAHAPHPRDLRLTQAREPKKSHLVSAVPSRLVAGRLLAHLQRLAERGEHLPTNLDMAKALGIEPRLFYNALAVLRADRSLACTPRTLHHRIWRLADGRELRSPGCPESMLLA